MPLTKRQSETFKPDLSVLSTLDCFTVKVRYKRDSENRSLTILDTEIWISFSFLSRMSRLDIIIQHLEADLLILGFQTLFSRAYSTSRSFNDNESRWPFCQSVWGLMSVLNNISLHNLVHFTYIFVFIIFIDFVNFFWHFFFLWPFSVVGGFRFFYCLRRVYRWARY